MMENTDAKRRLRAELLARRESLPDKASLSLAIWERLSELPKYQTAETVLFYVDVRSEVRTRAILPLVLATKQRLVVPYCQGAELELFWLSDMRELITGRFGILEPAPELRELSNRRVMPSELDFLVIPGVGFDRNGGRMGHGHGFYDRLLCKVPGQIPTVGLAFECQLVRHIPTEAHDVSMDAVITEKSIYSSGIFAR